MVSSLTQNGAGSNGGHCGCFHDSDTDFREAGLILRQQFGQDFANGLWPPTILSLPAFGVELANTVLHGSLLEITLILQNSVRM
jgi:hypothetical protein